MPPLRAQQAFTYSHLLLSLSCFSKFNEMCFYRDLWKVQLIIPLLNHLLSLHFFCCQMDIYKAQKASAGQKLPVTGTDWKSKRC